MNHSNEDEVAIGIDLGTAASCVAIFSNGSIITIPSLQGDSTQPSYLAFGNNYPFLRGEEAKRQAHIDPCNTIFDAKRMLGLAFNDPAIQEDSKLWPFKVVEGFGGMAAVEVQIRNGDETTGTESKIFQPVEILAMTLRLMKESAETYLGHKVTSAVVTCPAYYSTAQRLLTQDACSIAGLQLLRMINEPTAAAVAYNITSSVGGEQNTLVFDLGGGSFDVSLLAIDDGIVEVKATAGNNHLGGQDFVQRMMNHCVNEFKERNTGKDPTTSLRAMANLREACEQAKRKLSGAETAVIEIKDFFEG